MLRRISALVLVSVIFLAAPNIVVNANDTPPPAALHAQEGGETVLNIELIFDASGSMAGVIGDEVRIDAARRALTTVIDALPDDNPNINVGFRIYGHLGDNSEAQREASCQSTELVVPMAGVAKDVLAEQVASYEPTGWTPISLAMTEAAKDFPSGDNYRNVIILVTDGEETCDGDPCATAQTLADMDIIVHVVGFALEENSVETLSCISENTGGHYYDAQSGDALVTSVLSLVNEEAEMTGYDLNITSGSGTLALLDDAFDIQAYQIETTQAITYSSNVSLDEAITFYETTMTDLGWALAANGTDESQDAIFTFVGVDQTAFVTITDAGEKLDLEIFVEGTPIDLSGIEGVSIVTIGDDVDFQFPITDDASDIVASSDGEITYHTALSFAEVVEFYRTQPVNEGWTLTNETVLDFTSVADLNFERDGATATVAVTPDPARGGVAVTISID